MVEVGITVSGREGEPDLAVRGFGLNRVALWDLWRTGDDAPSALSIGFSSSLSACETESRPSNRSVAHLRILQPSPSLNPMSSLSKNASSSSKASW